MTFLFFHQSDARGKTVGVVHKFCRENTVWREFSLSFADIFRFFCFPVVHHMSRHKEVFYFQIWHIHPCICQRDLIKHLFYPIKRVCGPIYMENTPAWASSCDRLEQQTILSFPSGLNKVTFEVFFLLKETGLQWASYNY